MRKISYIVIATLIGIFVGSTQLEARIETRTQAISTGPTEVERVAKEKKVKVGYSFEHFAENSKVARLFISEDMLASMHEAGKLKSSHWDFDHIAKRLTSFLSLHTHSRSTTDVFRKDYNAVLKRKDYEQIYHLRENDVRVVVFGVRNGGKKLKELLIFRFRSDYCSRVVQLTGDLSIDDVASILRLKK